MRITAIALGLMLGAAVPLVAQEPAPGAPREGIKVHGDWTIEIRNVDGTVASRHEFKNALTTVGAAKLIDLLAGAGVPCDWMVMVFVSYNANSGGAGTCRRGDGCLSLSVHAADVTLQGELAPESIRRDIIKVRTTFSLSSPAGCPGVSPYPEQAFTEHSLDAPISVLPEQSVQFKVVLSFS